VGGWVGGGEGVFGGTGEGGERGGAAAVGPRGRAGAVAHGEGRKLSLGGEPIEKRGESDGVGRGRGVCGCRRPVGTAAGGGRGTERFGYGSGPRRSGDRAEIAGRGQYGRQLRKNGASCQRSMSGGGKTGPNKAGGLLQERKRGWGSERRGGGLGTKPAGGRGGGRGG